MKNRRNNFRTRWIAPAAAAAALLIGAVSSPAQYRMDTLPDGPAIAPKNPTIIAKPNALLPLDLPFTNSDGATVKLDDLFHHGRPVIMMMVYFSCPAMCGLNQDALARVVREGPRDLKLGKDYDVIIVSIDPDDTPAMAKTKRDNYLTTWMGRSPSQTGFTYLVGKDANIHTLADAIGFGYYRNPPGGTDKFAHSLGSFIVTPDGHVSKTIGDMSYTNDELHSALMAAADGRIGSSTVDKILLTCGAMRLNPNTGKYEQNPWFWAGTAGGLASMTFMAIFLGVMWRGEYKKHKQNQNQTDPPDSSLNPAP